MRLSYSRTAQHTVYQVIKSATSSLVTRRTRATCRTWQRCSCPIVRSIPLHCNCLAQLNGPLHPSVFTTGLLQRNASIAMNGGIVTGHTYYSPMASPPPVTNRCGCRGQTATLLIGTRVFTTPVFSCLWSAATPYTSLVSVSMLLIKLCQMQAAVVEAPLMPQWLNQPCFHKVGHFCPRGEYLLKWHQKWPVKLKAGDHSKMACLTMAVPVSPMRVMFLLRSLRSTCLTVPSSPADVKIAAQQEHRICQSGCTHAPIRLPSAFAWSLRSPA